MIRPINVAITMAAVYAAGVISMASYFSYHLLMAVIASASIAAFGNIVNDIFDIDLDREAKPFRPLPSGQVTVIGAQIAAIVTASLALLISCLINLDCLLISSAAIIMLLFYTSAFKGFGYWGNFVVAGVGGLAFFYGAAAVGNINGGWIAALFAFLFHLIREIIKDMEDYPADKEFGIQTGAVKYGLSGSRIFAIITIVILLAVSFIPFLSGIYKIGYLIAVILGTDIPLIYIAIRIFRACDRSTYRFLSGFMKALMPLGIIAIFLGSRGY